jgi:hypothetical protein
VRFVALVWLFLKDLTRRRLLWGLALLMVLVFAIGHWTSSTIEDAMGHGESFTSATRQAAARLDGLGDQVRDWLYFVVILIAAQVAPESRKNGTTQFVLTSGVGRGALAAAQLTALAIVVSGAVILVHVGFAVAFLHAGVVIAKDLFLGWAAFSDLARWPHLWPTRSSGAPFAHWGWPVTQGVLATAFWVSLGWFLHQRHDFGSRTAAK